MLLGVSVLGGCIGGSRISSFLSSLGFSGAFWVFVGGGSGRLRIIDKSEIDRFVIPSELLFAISFSISRIF